MLDTLIVILLVLWLCGLIALDGYAVNVLLVVVLVLVVMRYGPSWRRRGDD